MGEQANVLLCSLILMCGPWGFLIQLYSLDPATLLGQTPPEELASFPLACPPKFMSWIPGWWQPPAELLVWSVSGQISSHLRHHLHGPYSLYDRISKGIKSAIVKAGANHSGVLVTIEVQKILRKKKQPESQRLVQKRIIRLFIFHLNICKA